MEIYVIALADNLSQKIVADTYKSLERGTPTYITKKIFESSIDNSVDLQQMILSGKKG